METPQTLLRQELFDLMWQEPMTKLAQRWGVTPKDIIAMCEQYQVPRPPNGHWAQVNWGTATPKPDLPTLDAADPIELQKFRAPFASTKPRRFEQVPSPLQSAPDAAQQPTTVPQEPDRLVKVLCRLSSPHPIVARLKRNPESRRPKSPDPSNWQHPVTELTVSVSQKQQDRTLRILDAIYKAWESLGHATRENDGALLDGGEAVTFSLTEVYLRVDVRKAGQSWHSWEFQPTGKLALEITSRSIENMRRRWCDGNVQKLEDVLDSFVRAIPCYLDALRFERLDYECRKRQEIKAAQRLAACENRVKWQKQQIQELNQTIADWTYAKQIREYLAAQKEWMDSGQAQPRNPEAFAAWLEWAKWYADELCPLTFAGPPPGKTDVPTNTLLTELDVTRKTRHQLEGVAITDTDELFALSKSQIDERVPVRHWGFYPELVTVMQGLSYNLAGKDWNQNSR